MTTTLKSLGDDLALILDRQLLNEHGIDIATCLEVVVDSTGIHIRPILDDRDARVQAAARRVMDSHDETFRKLAR